jgi:hypothetical protein
VQERHAITQFEPRHGRDAMVDDFATGWSQPPRRVMNVETVRQPAPVVVIKTVAFGQEVFE